MLNWFISALGMDTHTHTHTHTTHTHTLLLSDKRISACTWYKDWQCINFPESITKVWVIKFTEILFNYQICMVLHQIFQPYNICNRGKQYLHTVGSYISGVPPDCSLWSNNVLPTLASPKGITLRLMAYIFYYNKKQTLLYRNTYYNSIKI